MHTGIYNSFFLTFSGQKFPGLRPTKLFSGDYAEIDDISVIRDGDHLFLLQM
jgi:potassium channel